ncbi:ABC transporter [Campylobacterota bacterium]|nr:ABC transporter [Campylobacterota bacterium]
MVSQLDLKLVKMQTTHYYQKRETSERITHRGKTYFDKYKRVDQAITANLMNEHFDGKVTIAHDLILPGEKVENIVFDFNGIDPQRFYHRAQLMLREDGFLNFTAYETATSGHLHLYIHKGHTTLLEGYNIAKTLSAKLAQKTPMQWRMFPNPDLPPEFNILVLPYNVYAKERGTSWSKHM